MSENINKSFWASRPLDAGAKQTLEALQRAFPVGIIATFKPQLVTCASVEEARSPSVAAFKFDFVPITDRRKIWGVYDAVHECKIELKDCLQMESTKSLLDFIVAIDDKHRFVLIKDHREIVGIATYADLQKLPVFPLVFGVLITVELLVVEWLRLKYHDSPEGWIHLLNKDEKKKIDVYWKKALIKNTAIDKLACTSFRQEYRAAIGSGLFAHDDVKREELRSCMDLRNEVCHAMDFGNTRERAIEFPQSVRAALVLIDVLEKELKNVNTK